MNKQATTESAFRDYLLGALAADKSEVLDERCVTDKDLSEQMRAAENDLIDSYLSGTLPADEALRFESHYLASPIRRERVLFGRAIGDFAKVNFQASATAASDARGSFWSKIFSPGTRVLQMEAAAAILVILLGGGWWLMRTREQNIASSVMPTPQNAAPAAASSPLPAENKIEVPDDPEKPDPAAGERQRGNGDADRTAAPREKPNAVQPPQKSVAAMAAIVLSPPMRGIAPPVDVSIPAGLKTLPLRLELEDTGATSYRAELRESATGRTVWQQSGLRPGERSGSRQLSFAVPTSRLDAQIYSVRVISEGSAPAIIGDYIFRVVQ